MSHDDLDARLAELGGLVDGWIRQALAECVSPAAQRFGALLEYHFGWRGPDLDLLATPAPAGKKLRPALALLVSQAVSGSIDAARAPAMAVELLHNFSLVHDDIQDRSYLRRHRPTLWSIWGMEQGINAGDALFGLAEYVLVRDGTALAAQMSAELNRTTLLLAEGQYLDIELQRGTVAATPETYEAMITRKTGVLFACACRLGAMAAGGSTEVADAYAAYGLELGLAFQEQDDLLGVWGRPEETGKPAAADIVERKRGLPAALALARADAPAWLRSIYDGHDGEVDQASVARVIAHFDALGLRQQVEARVQRRYAAALAALDRGAPRAPAAGHLRAICQALVARRT